MGVDSRKFINTHDQLRAAKLAGLPAVAIVPYYGKMGSSTAWGWKLYAPFDLPKAYIWEDDAPENVFMATAAGGMQAALAAAKERARELFGVTEWFRSSGRDYIPRAVAKRFPLQRRTKS